MKTLGFTWRCGLVLAGFFYSCHPSPAAERKLYLAWRGR